MQVQDEVISVGLIIKKSWLDLILGGLKTWEIRGSDTKRRGRIGLIASGTGMVFGSIELTGVQGPLSLDEFNDNYMKHRVSYSNKLYYLDKKGESRTYAWELINPIIYSEPVPYKHPQGAVIWVYI